MDDGRCDEAHDIRVVRLRSWSRGSLPASHIKEAFLSPCRDKILLQAEKDEVVVVSLHSTEDPSEEKTYKPPSAVRHSMSRVFNLQNIPDPPFPGRFERPSEVSTCRDSSCIPVQDLAMPLANFPSILNTISCCWGAIGEGYSADKQVGGFKQLLFIVGKHGLFIHGLPKTRVKLDQTFKDQTRGGKVKAPSGRWINWSVDSCNPTSDVCNRDPFLNYEIPPEMQSKNFITFLVDSQVQKKADVANLMFVGGKNQLCAGNILSYGIQYHSTSFSRLIEYFQGHLCRSGENASDALGDLNNLVIGKVFSGSSFDSIGMVFHMTDNSALDFAEGNIRHNESCSFFISICKVLSSGLEWFSVINPNKASTQSTRSQWPTFSIAGSYLFGLHENGHICVWSIVDGTTVFNIDVLQHYDLHDASLRSFLKQELHEGGMTKLQEESLSGQHYGRNFRHMDVAPDSSVIAVTDSLSIMYVLSVGQYFSHGLAQKSSETRHSPSNSLWSSAVGSTVIGSFTPQNASRRGVLLESGFISLHQPSGFSCKSNLMRLGFRQTTLMRSHHHPLRQVLLPMDHSNSNSIVCLNPFGVTEVIKLKNESHKCTIFFKMLQISGEAYDDRVLETCTPGYVQVRIDSQKENNICAFSSQGYVYFLQEDGLHVVLPPISASKSKLPDSLEGRWWFTGSKFECMIDGYSGFRKPRAMLKQWQMELLDKVLIYDGLFEAEYFAAENGWSQQVVRLRRLQLVLDYAQLDEVEQALDSLVDVGAAEAGVPRVLFCAQGLIVKSTSGDNELGQASRLLSLLARFVIKLIKQYGMLNLKNQHNDGVPDSQKNVSSLSDMGCNLHEMSRFLEVIRKMQHQLQIRRGRPQKEASDEVAAESRQDYGSPVSEQTVDGDKFSKPEDSLWIVGVGENGDKNISESSYEMFNRWEKGSINLAEIVREALRAGRLPLAVAQLHRLQSVDIVSQQHSQNIFKEVQFIGRAFVYELFCKGEASKAMIALSRLGEDVETVLRELAFGTVSRFIRAEVINELAKLGCLDLQDLEILEIISILERAYPSSNFGWSYGMLQRSLPDPTRTPSEPVLSNVPHLVCSLKEPEDFIITCGEANGVVLGDWNGTESSNPEHSSLEDLSPAYWVGPAVWLKIWDKRTLDRICVDQETLVLTTISWEARFQAAISRNDGAEVSFLLESIPNSVLLDGELRIRLDCSDPLKADYDWEIRTEQRSQDGLYGLVLDAVEIVIPSVRFLLVELGNACTSWIYQMIEEKIAKSHIFLQSYWHGTTQLVSLLARAGILYNNSRKLFLGGKTNLKQETEQAFHELVLRHCVRHTLPNFMGFYLDHHSLALDTTSSVVMQAVVGCFQHWALWLLSSRIKGSEYEMSFANARTILAHNFNSGHLASTTEMEDFILTVDDMAIAGGELMALSTLMYAPVKLEECLCSGRVTRYDKSSWQCTLENLQPMLQQYPTLWRYLSSACITPNTWWLTSFHKKSATSMRTQPGFSGYLQWREKIFSSACGDTSLVEMMPHWFPRSVRQLIRLSVQGSVIGGQEVFHGWDENRTLYSQIVMNENDPIAWENIVQKRIQDELYASSQLEDKAVGVGHHLQRGRAMAAFNSLLALRLQNFNAQGSMIREHVGKFQRGQLHMSSELHAVLSPLSSHEEKYLTNVLPLAIMNFENPVLVAAASSLLELCGFPAAMLRVDVAALSRISSFCKQKGLADIHVDSSIIQESDPAGSLARLLADEYREAGLAILSLQKKNTSLTGKLSRTLVTVLQILEKASLPLPVEKDVSAGASLFSGLYDGSELRRQQCVSSERWSLVTTFCNVHQLPISTVYLIMLARDNDWVGFLAEAQSEGCPLEVLISVASQEFTDPRLRSHILTVLKTLQTAWQKAPNTPAASISISQDHVVKAEATPCELFEILADCEQRKHPGTALLTKAKDMHWPLLAVISSCFPDVTAIGCLTVWLEITAARETSSIKVNDAAAHIAAAVGAAVEATNGLADHFRIVDFQYNRKNPKRRCLQSPERNSASFRDEAATRVGQIQMPVAAKSDLKADDVTDSITNQKDQNTNAALQNNIVDEQNSLSRMIVMLCEQQRFFPLLKAFELFIPSSSLLPFFRFLQAFSQMRISEAASHLGTFSSRVREESNQAHHISNRGGKASTATLASVSAVTAADTILESCPSPYERRSLLQLLSNADFGDGGAAAKRFRQLYWKIQLAEPALQQGLETMVQGAGLDDDALLLALESQREWDQARKWAQQLEYTGLNAKAMHHVTETQAETMVAEWREFLWDIPEERVALWKHCHELFVRHSLPSLQGGLFFLKHADKFEHEVSPSELHGILLFALQWLSGQITNTPPKYPVHQLRELETRIWLLAVGKSTSAQSKKSFIPSLNVTTSKVAQDDGVAGIAIPESIQQTANLVSLVDNHLRSSQARSTVWQASTSAYHEQHKAEVQEQEIGPKHKRRTRNYVQHKRTQVDKLSKVQLEQEVNSQAVLSSVQKGEWKGSYTLQDDVKEHSITVEEHSLWEERVDEQELGQAILSLLEVGQMSAARQLQQKLAPTHVPIELLLVETALVIAEISTSTVLGRLTPSVIPTIIAEHLQSLSLVDDITSASPLEALDLITKACPQGCGRGSCERITAVARIASFLGLSFADAFSKSPTQLLQLLSLKAQDSFPQAKLLVETHSMPAASVARILAESFLKGLLAAHRGGFMESSLLEEGPSPLLWRPSDFLKWAQLCQSESEMGHALMHIVLSGHEVPNKCEVELLVCAYGFYMSSSCLSGIDVLLTLASTRVESYLSEGDFGSLARLVTGINNFQSLHFILNILIENGQLELLLHKRAAVEAAMESSASVRGFRMAVLSTLKHFNPNDLDAFGKVFKQFDMKHEMAALVESRARTGVQQFDIDHVLEQSDELLKIMRYNVEAAEVWASVDAGNRARWNCAQASLISLQIRIPEIQWLNLTETNARRLFVEQSRFEEALVVAEAYNLNQPSEWAPVIWNQMQNPGWIEPFLAEFVAALPLPANMLMELARFYRSEVTGRERNIDFSTWLSPGGLPLDWAKYLEKSFRCLLKYVRDVKLRVQLATLATGFPDVLEICMRILDKVPETAGPLILRKAHGGGYLPLM